MEIESIRATMQLQAQELAKAHFRINNRRSDPCLNFFLDVLSSPVDTLLYPSLNTVLYNSKYFLMNQTCMIQAKACKVSDSEAFVAVKWKQQKHLSGWKWRQPVHLNAQLLKRYFMAISLL